MTHATAHLRDLARGAVRSLLPAHVRFERAGRAFLRGGEPEVHELPRLVEPGTTAIDVGSLIGDYAYSLCKLVGPEGLVLCVEPQPAYAKLLRAAAGRLKLPMQVVECALSSQEGEGKLSIPRLGGKTFSGFASLEHADASSATVSVALRRLDDVAVQARGRISFVKIDVEGHELEVLKGGQETLGRHRPNLLIEIEQRHSRVPIDQTFDFIRRQGYSGYYLDAQGDRIPLDRFDAEKNRALCSEERAGGTARPGYVSNFIFTPA